MPFVAEQGPEGTRQKRHLHSCDFRGVKRLPGSSGCRKQTLPKMALKMALAASGAERARNQADLAAFFRTAANISWAVRCSAVRDPSIPKPTFRRI